MTSQINQTDNIYTGIYKFGKKRIPIIVTANYISDEAIKKLAEKLKELYK